MSDDTDMTCMWGEMVINEAGNSALRCHHPLGKPFCDYVEEEDDEDECPLYKPTKESSYIEEEVRQYLEYTEEKK